MLFCFYSVVFTVPRYYTQTIVRTFDNYTPIINYSPNGLPFLLGKFRVTQPVQNVLLLFRLRNRG